MMNPEKQAFPMPIIEFIRILNKQNIIPAETSKDEMNAVFKVISAYSRSKILQDAKDFWQCWYAMQYGKILGIREERHKKQKGNKKKKAAQRCNAGRQAVKPSTV